MSDSAAFVRPAPMEGHGLYNRSSRVQAAEDWRTFLAHRGRELRPGGRLVVLTMALDEAGHFGYQPLLEALYAALMDLVEKGLVRAEEARRMIIPTVGRSRLFPTMVSHQPWRLGRSGACGLESRRMELHV